MRVFILLTLAVLVWSQSMCNVADNFCRVAWNQACPNFQLNIIAFEGTQYSFTSYDIISFRNLTIPQGNIQGRVAVKGYFFAGSSSPVNIASGVGSTDVDLPYSLVVGRDATYLSGTLFPLGNDTKTEEYIFAGGEFIGPQISRKTGSCKSPDCLDSYFDSSYLFYIDFTTRLAGYSQNVNYQLNGNAQGFNLDFTCLNSSDPIHFINISPTLFSTATSFTHTGCNLNAWFVFNIDGEETTTFQGNQMTNPGSGHIIYNVMSSSSVYITTNVHGSVYAINSSVIQNEDLTNFGVLVAGNIQLLYNQERAECSVVPISTSSSSASSSSTSQGVTSSSSGTVSGTTTSVSSSTGPINVCNCSCTEQNNTTPSPPKDDGCPYFDHIQECKGLDFVLNDQNISFFDYDVISFGGFVANTGDVQGRLAAKGQVSLGYGFSIGDQISLNENTYLSYSLISDSLTWGSGALFPDSRTGANIASMFIGGTISAPEYLEKRVSGNCTEQNCLADIFGSAQNCYGDLQNYLSSQPDSATAAIVYSQLKLDCTSLSYQYYVSVTGSQISNISWWGVSENCQSNAKWIINVIGTDNVDFHGDTIRLNPDLIVYNVIGSNRIIKVRTAVNGAILAPFNVLEQDSGVIRGKVIAGDITSSLQINRPECTATSTKKSSPKTGSTANIILPSFGLFVIILLAS